MLRKHINLSSFLLILILILISIKKHNKNIRCVNIVFEKSILKTETKI